MTDGKAIALRVPLALAPRVAREAMLRVMRSMSDEGDDDGPLALAVFLHDLHVALIGEFSIPVGLTVRAVADEGFFPTFSGTLSVTPAAMQSELRLEGSYQPPFGSLGSLLDNTVLPHAAQRSLQSLVTHIAMEMLDDARRVERGHRQDLREMHS
ncbi:MAG TPA: hypothetical protein VIK27_00855 [Candidatus Aquilonibacter sp.]